MFGFLCLHCVSNSCRLACSGASFFSSENGFLSYSILFAAEYILAVQPPRVTVRLLAQDLHGKWELVMRASKHQANQTPLPLSRFLTVDGSKSDSSQGC